MKNVKCENNLILVYSFNIKQMRTRNNRFSSSSYLSMSDTPKMTVLLFMEVEMLCKFLLSLLIMNIKIKPKSKQNNMMIFGNKQKRESPILQPKQPFLSKNEDKIEYLIEQIKEKNQEEVICFSYTIIAKLQIIELNVIQKYVLERCVRSLNESFDFEGIISFIQQKKCLSHENIQLDYRLTTTSECSLSSDQIEEMCQEFEGIILSTQKSLYQYLFTPKILHKFKGRNFMQYFQDDSE